MNRQKNSIDTDTQDARLLSQAADSLTWSVNSQAIPRFGRASRLDNKVHNVVQLINAGVQLTSSITTPTFLALTFSASTYVPQFNSWATVFDQYRIMEIEMWIIPASTTNLTQTNVPLYYTVIDYDDAATPSSIAALQAYQNVIAAPLTQGTYRKFRPHNAEALYGGGAFTSYGNRQSVWIDAGSPAAAHYGFKAGVDTCSQAVNFDFITRMWVQFRNVF